MKACSQRGISPSVRKMQKQSPIHGAGTSHFKIAIVIRNEELPKDFNLTEVERADKIIDLVKPLKSTVPAFDCLGFLEASDAGLLHQSLNSLSHFMPLQRCHIAKLLLHGAVS